MVLFGDTVLRVCLVLISVELGHIRARGNRDLRDAFGFNPFE
jgi:hypothetical protein